MSQPCLESGALYDKTTCGVKDNDDKFNAFNYILKDIKKDESEKYPSIRTSLNIVYANDSRRFSVRCWTRKCEHYGPQGVFSSLRPCQFFVTGKYMDGKSAAKINRCRLKHDCQEDSFKKAKAKIEKSLDDPDGIYSSSQRQRRTYKRALNEDDETVGNSTKKARTKSFKSRSLNDILHKTRSPDGKVLLPKQVLQALRERKNNLRYRIEAGDAGPDVLKEFTVATEELCVAEVHLKAETKKSSKPRQSNKKSTSEQASVDASTSRKPSKESTAAATKATTTTATAKTTEKTVKSSGRRKKKAQAPSQDSEEQTSSRESDRNSTSTSWFTNLISKGIGGK